jgi:4-coumarate--CoA ligase (photoactive yellow protein activation family)
MAFKTSGSSGEPRFALHDAATLAQEVDALRELVPDTRRVIALVPANHIYGFLFTVLLPQRLGVPVIDARVHSPPSIPAIARAGDLVVGFPTGWHAAAAAGTTWPAGIVGVSSGAPCAPEVGADLLRLGLRQLVEIYGATETGGIGWRATAAAPYRLLPHWQRVDAERVRRAPPGAPRMLNTRDIARAACDSSDFELPDVVEWRDARHLVPVRRRDRAVQVGGVNVQPDLVCSVLLAHPAVAAARVRLMRPDEGERLKAFIVTRDPGADRGELCRDLESWVEQRLQPPERPRAFAFGASLPANDAGKPADWDIDRAPGDPLMG